MACSHIVMQWAVAIYIERYSIENMALGEEILLTECIILDVLLFWLCRIMPSFNITALLIPLWLLVGYCGYVSWPLAMWLCCVTSLLDGMTG